MSTPQNIKMVQPCLEVATYPEVESRQRISRERASVPNEVAHEPQRFLPSGAPHYQIIPFPISATSPRECPLNRHSSPPRHGPLLTVMEEVPMGGGRPYRRGPAHNLHAHARTIVGRTHRYKRR